MAFLDNYPRIQALFNVRGRPKQYGGKGWEARQDMSAFHSGYNPIFTISYDGEKNQGSIGPIKRFWLDYVALRARSWQSYLESEITQGIIKKYSGWVIGSGLKLQSEPAELVLESEGIKIEKKFSKLVQARFRMFVHSKRSDHAGIKSLQQQAHTAHRNAMIGGDVLVVQRLIEGNITIQLIDGSQVVQPTFANDVHNKVKQRGNVIRHGIEMDANGEHIAFYVRRTFDKFTRIEAKPAGLLTAFMVYGLEYRIDGNRGIPLISSVMQSIKMVDRYRDATVGSAEERQKITFAIEHNAISTGENPFIKQVQAAFNVDAEQQTGKIDGEAVANKVAATTDKQVVNMPPGATLKALESKNELYYKDFYESNTNSIASAIGIPPEVAYSKYDSNFSASRAALKDWEHTLNIERNNFSAQFYQPIFNFWLEVEILTNKITAPGYLVARANGNDMVLESYQKARFTGANVPHIDPVKEVKAERLKLGQPHLPLTTAEAATEALNGGEYDTNVEQVLIETEAAGDLDRGDIEEDEGGNNE